MSIAPHSIQYYFVVLGGVISLIGLKMYVDFIRTNPLQPEEAPDAG